MRRIIYIITALLSLACTKEIVSDPSSGSYSDGAIHFATSVEQTRATEMTSDALCLEDTQFQVMAFVPGSDSDVKYFNSTVTYTDSEWSYDNTKLWPSSGSVTFHACYPSYVSTSWWQTTSIDDHQLMYSCPAGVYAQVDLLVASLEAEQSDVTVIPFTHALSEISFKVSFVDEANVFLQSIDVEYCGGKFAREGEYNFSNKSWSLSDVYYADDEVGRTTTMDYNGQIYSKNDTRTFEHSLMILPQEITEESQIQVTVNYYTLNFANGAVTSFDPAAEGASSMSTFVQASAMLTSIDGSGKYEMGKNYNYTLSIQNGEITLGGITVEGDLTTDETYGNIYLEEISLAKTSYDSLYEDAADVEAFASYFNSSILPSDIDEDEKLTSEDIESLLDDRYYYTTALRVRKLLESGVRDFIIVGDYGASDGNPFGDNAMLGYWGGASSPFNIAVWSSDSVDFNAEEDLFSIDMRNVTGLPEFQHVHSSIESDAIVDVLDPTDPVIPTGTFYYVNNLREIILPTEVRAIDEDAFAGCYNLLDIDIQNVIHLEAGALNGCSALTHVYNGALTRVHNYAAQDCSKLTQIDLSLTQEIDDYAFNNCESLTQVDLSSLRSVGAHAFADCTQLTFSSNASSPLLEGHVGEYAFESCSALGGNGECTFDLSAVETVGGSAFLGCEELEFESDMRGITWIEYCAFKDCTSMGYVDLESVTYIGKYAFNKCVNLTLQPEMLELTTIGNAAFQGCSILGEITIPAISSLGTYAFQSCPNLQITPTQTDGVTYANDSLTAIGEHAFNGCSSLDNYFEFNNVESVGTYAFASCSNLLGLTMNSLTTWDVEFFASCTSLKVLSLESLALNNMSKTIDDKTTQTDIIVAAASMSGTLEILDLSSLVCDVPGWSFKEAPDLKEIDLATAGAIGAGAFYGCSKLEVADVSSATSLGDQAFYGCSKLETTDMSSVTSIGYQTFGDCLILQELYLTDVEAIRTYSAPFSGCTSLMKLDLQSLDHFFDSDGNTYEIADGHYYIFEDIAEDCVIKLSQEQYDKVVASGNLTTWCGRLWGKILSPSDSF